MASNWARLRLHYIGNIRISRLVTPVVVLLVLFVIYRLMKSPKYGIVNYKEHTVQHKMLQDEIDDYLDNLRDTRPEHCIINYHAIMKDKMPSVSILVDFHDDEIYNLKLTLSSIMRNTPDELITEIVVLDDGSSNFHMRQHAAEFLLNEKFKGKVRPFRSADRHGRASTRFKASKVAQGEMLVFISSSVVVNGGWLQPLITALLESDTRIIVPHSDNFLSEKRFFKMDEKLITTFSWPLSTVYVESSQDTNKYLETPVMRGDLVAVSKHYLELIGNYDEGIGLGGGEDFELSLRTWMCGGQVLMSSCSRIATHNALKPVDVTGEESVRRISELWMDNLNDVVYKQTDKSRTMSIKEEESLIQRRSWIKKYLHCQSFEWYLNNIAQDIITPTDEMQQFGKLKASSGYCTRSLSDLTEELDMVTCRPFMYEISMLFEFDSDGRIRKGDKCLMAPGRTSRLILTTCQSDNRQQKWKPIYGKMISDAFPGMCLTHVTETGANKVHLHHAALSACVEREETPKQIWSFIRY